MSLDWIMDPKKDYAGKYQANWVNLIIDYILVLYKYSFS